MRAHVVDMHATPAPVSAVVDSCASCRLFWFDTKESLRLTPRAVLDLFRTVSEADQTPLRPLRDTFGCPRCRRALALVHDTQRGTRFTYWRCAHDGGKLETYHQFLREKDFIRAPNPAELAQLRATVRQVSCSQCGAPIDLTRDTACGHCRAPLALIDPTGIAATAQELQRAAALPAKSGLAPEQVEAVLQIGAAAERAQQRALVPRHDHAPPDLVIGAAHFLGSFLGSLLD